MNRDHADEDLERRFREVLQEVMPQLEPIANRQSLWNDEEWITETDHEDALAVPTSTLFQDARAFPRRPLALMIAAAAVAIAGVGAAFALTVGRGVDRYAPTASIQPTTTTLAVQAEPMNSPLTTEVPEGTQPMMVLDRAGWVMDGHTGPGPVYQAAPSATCAGCGVTRLIVAADGPLFAGPVFTAWTLDDDYDIKQFASPVTIGTTEGRFTNYADGNVPAAVNQVRVVWSLGPGRTAFVEADGLSNEQVFAMAATLTFESAVPILPNVPAGFAVVSIPSDAQLTTQIYNQFNDGTPHSAQFGVSSIELIVTDGGLQGLFDWRNPGRPLGWGEPRTINGTTVLVDRDPDPNEPPILTIEATWTVGSWNYLAIGHVFATEEDFLDAVASLRLTDAATFANIVPVTTYEFTTLIPNIDGSGGVFTPSDGQK